MIKISNIHFIEGFSYVRRIESIFKQEKQKTKNLTCPHLGMMISNPNLKIRFPFLLPMQF